MRVARKLNATLREFVYLDEVSVFSLIASRLGPVAAEFTDTQSDSLKSELQTTAGATVGVAKGEAKSRSEVTNTRTSQVLRKATVQATFKDLYELEEGNLAIRPFTPADKPPTVRTLGEIEARFGEPAFDGWVLGPGDWRRGQLMELEIELEADPIYRIGSVLTSLVDLINDSPELFPPSIQAELRNPIAVNRVLERLMVGLIPIRGKSTEYRVIRLRDTALLVHTRLLDQLGESAANVEDLYVVGVTEQRLYWKDIRQVLYSDSRFRVFCRVNHDDLADTWKPVKMVDILGGVVPDLPDVLSRFSVGAERLLSGGHIASESSERQASCMQKALLEYAQSVTDHCNAVLTPDLLAELHAISILHRDAFSDHAARRQAFDAMRSAIESRTGSSIASDPAASLRATALINAGLTLDGQLAPEEGLVDVDDSQPEPAGFIDAEIVSIYW
ncbi:hypothetical protein ABZ491_07175 [Micromonospora rifamycinica]|uniref:DUF6414 family protein n=1 Tax=Micromonospora rifamycinica TaxID=291594 RepID=UPI0033EF270A